MEVCLDDAPTVQLEKVPHVLLVDSGGVAWVQGNLSFEELFHEHLKKFFGESAMFVCSLDALEADCVQQDGHEAFQLGAREEHDALISEVARAEAEEVIDEVGGALAVLSAG